MLRDSARKRAKVTSHEELDRRESLPIRHRALFSVPHRPGQPRTAPGRPRRRRAKISLRSLLIVAVSRHDICRKMKSNRLESFKLTIQATVASVHLTEYVTGTDSVMNTDFILGVESAIEAEMCGRIIPGASSNGASNDIRSIVSIGCFITSWSSYGHSIHLTCSMNTLLCNDSSCMKYPGSLRCVNNESSILSQILIGSHIDKRPIQHP